VSKMNLALNPELFLGSLNDGVYAVDTDRIRFYDDLTFLEVRIKGESIEE
jgi:hypothetical protein